MMSDDVLEPATTSRSRCRQCRKEIEEGDLRFGSNYEGLYGDGPAYAWFHVRCASQRMPDRLLPLLRKKGADEVDDYDKILAACDKNTKKSASKFPYGERAPSGRAKCVTCDQAIAKGELRVAVEREIQTGTFTQIGAGYLHPACAVTYLEDPELGARLKAASPLLTKKDGEEIAALCDAAAKKAPAAVAKKKTEQPRKAKPVAKRGGDELVYADQLIEKGDPRGEMIVVESELESVGIDDLKGPKLSARAEELRAKAMVLWSKEIGISKASFWLDGGLPSRVPVQLGARKLGKVPDHKWIVGYRARSGSEETLAALLRHPSFARIRHLIVDGVFFTWDGLKGFCACEEVKNLESLDVALNLGPRALLMFLGSLNFERLTRLTIGASFTMDPDLRGFDRIVGLPSLKALHFKAAIYADIVMAILRSPLAERLEEIGMPPFFAPDALAGLKLPNLRRLYVRSGFLQPKVLEALAAADLPSLALLDISGANVNSATALVLANKKTLPKLRHLDVSRNPIDAATLEALRARFGDQLISQNMIEPPRKRKATGLRKKQKVTAAKKKRATTTR